MKVNIVHLSFIVVMQATLLVAEPYSNVITEIREIAGHSTYSLMIRCQSDSPIITYAPISYQESLDEHTYRAFMPNTKLAEGVSDIPGILEQTDRGVEIVLLGQLQEKIIDSHMVLLVVELEG